MIRSLDDVGSDAWQEATRLLSEVGVFADEARKFPEPDIIEGRASDLDRILREKGYAGGDIGFAEITPSREGVSLLVFDTSKITDSASAELHWYEDYRKRWNCRVKERVADWLKRLADLRQTIEGWLPDGFSIKDRPSIAMHEEMMRNFAVAPALMPSFDIMCGDRPIVRVQPKALWTIGANGRVDLVGREGTIILVDQSVALSGAPEWVYYAPHDRKHATALSRESFLQLLG